MELVIVVTIIVTLVGIGGFKYLEYKNQAVALEYKNHADNLSRIISNMYRTGIYGDNKQYDFKGAYPSVETMNKAVSPSGPTLLKEILDSYDEQNEINFVTSTAVYHNTLDPAIIIPGIVSSSDSETSVQQKLADNSDLVIYHPLHPNFNADGSRGAPKEPCDNQVNGADNCREAVIYYVNYVNGKYQLAESNRLRAGIEEK